VEPQHIEGYFEGGGQSNLVLLSPAGLSRTYASSLSRYSAGGALAEIMKGINLGYAQYYKGKNNHIGHFWQDRYKSIIISKDEYLLACGSYVELNPVRARIVEDPKDYKWSSYGAYAYGETVSVVERHGIHNALAEEAGERRKKYREFVRGMLREKKAMKEEMGRRVVYGNKAFIKKMQMAYKVEALIKPKGRLRKSANDNN
jgi:putative transposase